MSERPKRKEHRLINYDYSQNGAYFVTICTKNMAHYFWDENNTTRFPNTNLDNPIYSVGAAFGGPRNKIKLSEFGKIVKNELKTIPNIYTDIVFIHKFVIMPNHIHMIIVINKNFEANDNSGPPKAAPTLGRIINQFKGSISKKCGFKIWQKSFYDRVIRNNREYLEIWRYIENNPINWLNGIEEDEFYKGEIYND